MFENAHHFNTHGGKFIDVGGNYYENAVYVGESYSGMKTLYSRIATGALHNSYERRNAPRCHPGTRLEVLDHSLAWVQRPNPQADPIKLLWFDGPAGAGKSAIQQSIADRCNERKMLAASFFFSHQSDQRDSDRLLIATLAYQLAQKLDTARDSITTAVVNDHSVFDRDHMYQLDALIIRPITAAIVGNPAAVAEWPKAIIIDGLDECKEEGQQKAVLVALHEAVVKHKLPFSIIIASRADPAVREFFYLIGEGCMKRIELNTIYQADNDIAVYLRSEFDIMCQKYRIEKGSWPSKEEVQGLVAKASGQFIYAATALKFIDGPSQRPKHNIGLILQVELTHGCALRSHSEQVRGTTADSDHSVGHRDISAISGHRYQQPLWI
ncbi:hypothetical protein FA15DRAFT_167446 [Coprinopsis marcescibilis]|uniref:Nephrocystin 3-like N-terminal domain-containing protein n=1 Tax=Coprinopsis marcescibilis TaxID=230819 RepID=A0A5C3KHV3_COPMA|nr:hypothetical protein FA15DRAFT_167446 [Coprinopsis marcescibilis]